MANKWYVVHTYSGHEDRVKSSLEKAVANLGLGARISQVLVPTEDVVEIKRNKNISKNASFSPDIVL